MRIIYFDIDCLRPDHLGCYGYNRPTSPAIDSIAEQGIRFDHYYCASSPCLPSRTAMMSGRCGIHNGVVSNHGVGASFNIDIDTYGGPMPENEMFPRQLRKHGYDTICFSNFADRHYAMWYMCGWSEFYTPSLKSGSETAKEINELVIPWLQRNATRENYYLHINYWDTHRPYKMDASWGDKFEDYPVTQDWPDQQAIELHQKIKAPFTAHGQFEDDESPFPLMPGAIDNRKDFEKMITAYDASISYLDYHIKKVLDVLEESGVMEDTVIIISGDHGDAFGEHGIYSDHVNVDDCIHHIPLIMRWPGVTKPGSVNSNLMSNIDYAPTLCEILDIPIPTEWQGISYYKNIKGSDEEKREFICWDSALYTVQRAVRDHNYLYIRTYDSENYDNWESEELYKIKEDPYQTKNLASNSHAATSFYRQLMDSWVVEKMSLKNAPETDPINSVLEERGLR